MTTTLRSARRISSVLLMGLVVALLGACSTTVVREPSARRTTVMRASGSRSPGFSAATAGSFQRLILPR